MTEALASQGPRACTSPRGGEPAVCCGGGRTRSGPQLSTEAGHEAGGARVPSRARLRRVRGRPGAFGAPAMRVPVGSGLAGALSLQVGAAGRVCGVATAELLGESCPQSPAERPHSWEPFKSPAWNRFMHTACSLLVSLTFNFLDTKFCRKRLFCKTMGNGRVIKI